MEVSFFQSNHEGAIVDEIQAAYGVYDGIVINPAAYTHTSVAILDALKAVAIPAVEVHISDVDAREPFRQVSYAGMACVKTYKGLGFDGYIEAVRFWRTIWHDLTKNDRLGKPGLRHPGRSLPMARRGLLWSARRTYSILRSAIRA